MTSMEKMAVTNAVILKSNENELEEVLGQVLFSEFIHPPGRTLDSEIPRHRLLLTHS